MTPAPFPCVSSTRLSDDQLSELADDPRFVLPIYALVLIPLALYVYHDIIDKRWRHVYLIRRYVFAYIALYLATATAMLAYIVIQWRYGMDYKEVGAGTLTLVVGFHRLWTLIRIIRILNGHRALVAVLRVCHVKLSHLAVDTGYFREIKYFRFRRPPPGEPHRHLAISASLFDDDYPGDSPRIFWLRRVPTVHPDDVKECTARIAIWMRAVLRSTNVPIWDLLTASNFLVLSKTHRNLYATLVRLLLETSAPVPPSQVNANPAEALLNNPQEPDFRDIGVGIVWMSARMRTEEVAQIVSEMPASWMNDTLLSGKELMFETGVCLMLAGIGWSTNTTSLPVLPPDFDLSSLKLLQTKEVDRLFAWAVAETLRLDLMNDSDDSDDDDDDKRGAVTDKEYDKLMDVVDEGLSHLRVALEENLAEKRCYRLKLARLIRGAYYGGYVVEGVLGEHERHISPSENVVKYPLYLAELVYVLHELLRDVGWCDGEKVSEHLPDTAGGNVFMCSREERGACPAGAFVSFVIEARYAAWEVVDSFQNVNRPSTIKFKDKETRMFWLG